MVQATLYKVQGSAMKFTNKINTPEVNPTNFLDTLCQGFEGGSFYGLEYVLDDFLENTKEKPSVPVLPGFDWFGLDS
jgi:3-isopropylmalate dehydratase small subunit